jgi:hypothetical protein
MWVIVWAIKSRVNNDANTPWFYRLAPLQIIDEETYKGLSMTVMFQERSFMLLIAHCHDAPEIITQGGVHSRILMRYQKTPSCKTRLLTPTPDGRLASCQVSVHVAVSGK